MQHTIRCNAEALNALVRSQHGRNSSQIMLDVDTRPWKWGDEHQTGSSGRLSGYQKFGHVRCGSPNCDVGKSKQRDFRERFTASARTSPIHSAPPSMSPQKQGRYVRTSHTFFPTLHCKDAGTSHPKEASSRVFEGPCKVAELLRMESKVEC